jgi:hypothetical protein
LQGKAEQLSVSAGADYESCKVVTMSLAHNQQAGRWAVKLVSRIEDRRMRWVRTVLMPHSNRSHCHSLFLSPSATGAVAAAIHQSQEEKQAQCCRLPWRENVSDWNGIPKAESRRLTKMYAADAM